MPAWDAGKSNRKIMIISLGVIAVLLIVIVVLITRKPEEEEKRNVVVTKDNVEEVVDDMLNQKYIEPGYYSTQMSTVWNFTTGDAVSEDAYVVNDEDNTNDVYFDVFLADDESTPILKSPVIPRGGELRNIALDQPLDAGTHDCVMVYHLVDEEQNTVSTLRVGFTIHVEK